jgi:hypothetical protein
MLALIIIFLVVLLRGSGPVPSIDIVTLNTHSPASNNQVVGTLTATQGPTSWSIVSCRGCREYFAISNSGAVTVTSMGAFILTADKTSAVTSFNLVVSATNSAGTSSNATIAINVYADGLARAPAGVGAQYADLLNSYGPGNARNSTSGYQPPWRVAGVDYGVGYSLSACGGSLFDPNTMSISGVSVDTTTGKVNITGASVTIQCFDFSLESGKWYIVISSSASGTVTIKNNNFLVTSSFTQLTAPIFADASVTANLAFTQNVLDGGGNPTQGGSQPWTASKVYAALAIYDGTGSCTFTYNWFKNDAASSVVGVAGCRLLMAYNLVDNAGLVLTQHKNFIQWSGLGTSTNPAVIYNTGIQTTNGGNSQTYVGEMWQVDAQNGCTINDAEVGRNIAISRATSAGKSSSFVIAGHSIGDDKNMGLNIHDDYVDISGAYGALYLDAASGSFSVSTCSNILNMNTGKRITGRFGAATCN